MNQLECIKDIKRAYKISKVAIATARYAQVPKDHIMLRLKEIEVCNLESIVERQAKELREMGEINAKFMSILANDLRNPYNSILETLEILKKNINNYNVNEIERLIKIGSRSANKSLTLLESLLEWSALQNEKKTFHSKTNNFQEFPENKLKNFYIQSSLQDV